MSGKFCPIFEVPPAVKKVISLREPGAKGLFLKGAGSMGPPHAEAQFWNLVVKPYTLILRYHVIDVAWGLENNVLYACSHSHDLRRPLRQIPDKSTQIT